MRFHCTMEILQAMKMREVGKMMEFLIKQFPRLNHSCFTIIPDQNKGPEGAMNSSEFEIRPFYCIFHRAENIKKIYGGKCVADFWKMVRCKSVAVLEILKSNASKELSIDVMKYILQDSDSVQIPIVGISSGGNLYGHVNSG